MPGGYGEVIRRVEPGCRDFMDFPDSLSIPVSLGFEWNTNVRDGEGSWIRIKLVSSETARDEINCVLTPVT